jgi:hypothetical protein
MARRVSTRVTLVLIGAAALQACSGEPDTTQRARDTYLSLDECAADWGRPEHCERQEMTTGAGTSTFFHGPVYYAPYRDTAQMEAREAARRAGMPFALSDAPSNRSIGRTTLGSPTGGSTSRSGFGSSARMFSGGS